LKRGKKCEIRTNGTKKNPRTKMMIALHENKYNNNNPAAVEAINKRRKLQKSDTIVVTNRPKYQPKQKKERDEYIYLS
jgi:hypothetical protein